MPANCALLIFSLSHIVTILSLIYLLEEEKK